VPPATVGTVAPAKVTSKVVPVALPAVSPVEQEQARLMLGGSRMPHIVPLI
jgi:hypothetical protein